MTSKINGQWKIYYSANTVIFTYSFIIFFNCPKLMTAFKFLRRYFSFPNNAFTRKSARRREGRGTFKDANIDIYRYTKKHEHKHTWSKHFEKTVQAAKGYISVLKDLTHLLTHSEVDNCVFYLYFLVFLRLY